MAFDLDIAFWDYDLYPYCLWGEVSNKRDDGCVYIRAYQTWLRPRIVLDNKAGNELAVRLAALRASYEQGQRDLLRTHSEQGHIVAPFIKQFELNLRKKG